MPRSWDLEGSILPHSCVRYIKGEQRFNYIYQNTYLLLSKKQTSLMVLQGCCWGLLAGCFQASSKINDECQVKKIPFLSNILTLLLHYRLQPSSIVPLNGFTFVYLHCFGFTKNWITLTKIQSLIASQIYDLICLFGLERGF